MEKNNISLIEMEGLIQHLIDNKLPPDQRFTIASNDYAVSLLNGEKLVASVHRPKTTSNDTNPQAV